MSRTRENENRRNFLIRFFKGGASVATLAVWFDCAAVAQVSPSVVKVVHLEASAGPVDPATHRFDVRLTNLSQKTIVAYTLEMRALNGSGRPLNMPPSVVGTDYAFNLVWGPDCASYGCLLPGVETTKQFGFLSDAASAAVKALAVVYEDVTSEGDPEQVGRILHTRAIHAGHAASGAALLADYPASPTEARSRLDKLAAIREHTGAVERLLKNQGAPDRQQWAAAAAEQKKLADVLAAQSKEPTQ